MTRDIHTAINPMAIHSIVRPRRAGLFAAALAATALLVTMPAAAQDGARPDAATAEQDIDRAFSQSVGLRMLEIVEQESAGEWALAIDGYTGLLDRSRLTRFERAAILLSRGRALYESDDIAAAIEDWRSAISINALTLERSNTLRINNCAASILQALRANGPSPPVFAGFSAHWRHSRPHSGW